MSFSKSKFASGSTVVNTGTSTTGFTNLSKSITKKTKIVGGKIVDASRKAGPVIKKGGTQVLRHYGKYVKPTVKLATRVGKFALGAGKLALRHPGTTLALAALGSTVKWGKRIQKRPKFRTVTLPKKGDWGGTWM